jgi:hypothetical protein
MAEANKKFYTRKKTINGKEYTAQFNGLSTTLSALDNCYIDDSKNLSNIKLANYIFDNVIVEPKGLTPDDFDDIDEFNEVIKWAQGVMQGKFRDKE